MIARALAGEANVPFYYASGSDFSAPYWGVGVLKIKKLFSKARRSRRSIIFIDEFDAVARGRRSTHSGVRGHKKHDT
jgi:cell division protease FtsH